MSERKSTIVIEDGCDVKEKMNIFSSSSLLGSIKKRITSFQKNDYKKQSFHNKDEMMVHTTINNMVLASEVNRKEECMSKQSEEEQFSCPVCSKLFFNSRYLTKHMHRHKGNKPFPCTDCSKSFSWKSDLRKHMRTHTGDKPFACTVCFKSFYYNCDLMRHYRIHTGEKPFSCDVCSKLFSTQVKLRRHKQSHIV